MTLRRSITYIGGAAAVPIIAVGVAACGGNSSTPSTTPPASNGGTPTTISVANRGNLGNILVDSQGRTLYLFAQDTGTTSTCNGACATAWPPLKATGTPTVGGGANTLLVGTSMRSDNTMQVTYNGHPLYLFSGDAKAGDTNGQGKTAFGAAWFAVTSTGNQASGQSSGSGGTTSPSGGGLGY